MPRKAPKTFSIGAVQPRQFREPIGKKPIYLPNITLTLLRTPFLPPHFASFLTPLNINKLDLKDYLYHGYGLKALSIRSYVIQQKVRLDKPGAKAPKRKYFRPRAKKKMTVELASGRHNGPFVWPETPEDLSPWDNETYTLAASAQDAARDKNGLYRDMAPNAGATSIAEQARELLKGKTKGFQGGMDLGGLKEGERAEGWRPGWVDYGVGMETERDRWRRESRRGR